VPSAAETRAGTDFTDQDLVARVRAGDDLAFERLYARYHRRIAAYVQGMVKDHARAEDITQDVFMSALRRMRATERPIAFKPWIYEIAKNACIDAFRRSRRAEEVSYDAEDGLARADQGRLISTGPTPDAAVDTRMSLDHLRGAFGGLSETHHEILVLRELEGLSYQEIGRRLGMTRASVESTLFRARRRLTEEYEELVSGERCRRVQGIVAGARGGRLGARDERRLARHVAHCPPCRRAAAVAGFDLAALAERRSVGAKVAAWLPLPAFLRRWVGGGGNGHAGSASSGGLPQWTATAAQYAESAGWVKAAAVAATLAVAGVGAGVATHAGGGAAGKASERPAASHAARKPAAATTAAARHEGRRPAASSAGAARRERRAAAGGAAKTSRDASAVPTRRGARSRGRRAGDGSGSGGSGGGGGAGSGASGGGGASAHGGGHAAAGGAGGAGASAGAKTGVNASRLPASAPTVLAPSASAATHAVTKTVNTVTGATGGAVKTVTDTVTQTAKDPVGTVSGAVRDPVGTATKTVDTVTGAANDTLKQVGDAANGAVRDVTSQAPAPVQKLAGAATSVTEKAPAAVQKVTGAANGVVKSLTGQAARATDAGDSVTDATKTVAGLLPGG
jgi:RNA polymerase sigma factor (sigma-70 family)